MKFVLPDDYHSAKRVFIIHGYGGNPKKNWFPWLKNELEKLGIEVIVPAMPDTDNPNFSAWLAHLQAVVANPDENTYLVGHSLGCITILQFLNALSDNVKIGGIILVAGFAKPIHFTELDGFFTTPLNEEKIKNQTHKIIAINSDNDEHVPYELAENIKQRFHAELIKVKNGGHLNHKTGYLKFPLVLEKLKEIF